MAIRSYFQHAFHNLSTSSDRIEAAAISLMGSTHIINIYCPPDITEGLNFEAIKNQISQGSESRNFYFSGDLNADPKSNYKMAQHRWQLIKEFESQAPENFLFIGTGESACKNADKFSAPDCTFIRGPQAATQGNYASSEYS